MTLEFDGEAIEWRGPAPFVFVPVPPDLAAEIRAVASRFSYGWGVIPAVVRIGKTQCTTSLFPKDGSYWVPVKVDLQRSEGVKVGDVVHLELELVSRSKPF